MKEHSDSEINVPVKIDPDNNEFREFLESLGNFIPHFHREESFKWIDPRYIIEADRFSGTLSHYWRSLGCNF
jgi:hypothetical protein